MTAVEIFTRQCQKIQAQHSKHSRVCHALLFETPLFIGVYAMCNCTFRILHLAVFSQFRYQALPLQFNMETYRSGHNGADSKSVREQSPASSNLAVSAKDNRNLRIAVVFFLWYNVIVIVLQRRFDKQ